ncbi:DUF4129 domain-containing protein [Natrinema salsiterrestre]|uniref:DUF4129 domain-containing protein n=1 Tax=Natrinema salsiterrestre TaxID=2950540 RepID=A0A9Q4Q350_9EURY|nr:DUF4129 domain-containing protein [Natrinema salsiterrestre]MDF9745697.1 DUF4129 domain-containing protein [Natrinema salsiterrestre]
MTGTRRLLFVVGCLCCLLAVASALPAADPRIDGPGDRTGEPVAGDWDAMEATPEFDANTSADRDDLPDGDSQPDEIEIDGAVEPGNEVTVDIGGVYHFTNVAIAVNGRNRTHVDELGRANVTVPYAEEMTVSVPDENRSRTVDVRTDATIEPQEDAAPNRGLEITATVGSTDVPDATVTLDGDPVAETDDNGTATVAMPEEAGPVDLRVERGPVTGDRTVDVAEPTVRFVTPVLFPGSPAEVQVSADGRPVSGATVSVEGGGRKSTDGDGRATMWLPISDAATVSTEVGAESATTSVGNLYLRLTAVVVLVPGFAIGVVVSYLRLAAASENRRERSAAGLFLAFADGFEQFAAALRALTVTLSEFSLPSISAPTFSAPRLEFGGVGGFEFPSLGPALSSFGRAFGTLPSLGSLEWSSNTSTGSPLRDLFGTSDDDDASDESTGSQDDGPRLAARPLEPRGPRAEIRAAWHAFLDRLEVDDRETATPGEIARDALASGFPADRVDRLVAIVRDVEYGGREPSTDRVAAARAAVRELREHDPDDEEGAT